MDECCELEKGEVFQDYDCLLNFTDEKSDKFYRIQVLKNDKGFHVWTRWGRNVSYFDRILKLNVYKSINVNKINKVCQNYKCTTASTRNA